jgi:hypothetical protein
MVLIRKGLPTHRDLIRFGCVIRSVGGFALVVIDGQGSDVAIEYHFRPCDQEDCAATSRLLYRF